MNEALKAELLKMQERDLATRQKLVDSGELFQAEYHPEMRTVHEANNKRMREILNNFGWPGYKLVGEEGCHAAWLIIQHAVLELELQMKAVELLEQAVIKGEADMKMLALLQDRVLMQQGKPQKYGSQHIVNADNKLEPYKLADPETVNQRRYAIGLEPLEIKTAALNAERDASLQN